MFSINESEYTQMTDEKLIENIKQEDQKALDCLIDRYNDVVSMKANRFFMVGAEKEDMIQEGMIGLNHAIEKYKERLKSFISDIRTKYSDKKVLVVARGPKATEAKEAGADFVGEQPLKSGSCDACDSRFAPG
mgnify:CR=1 FL=1